VLTGNALRCGTEEDASGSAGLAAFRRQRIQIGGIRHDPVIEVSPGDVIEEIRPSLPAGHDFEEEVASAVQRLERCSTVCTAWAAKLVDVAGAKPLRIEINDYIFSVTMRISSFDGPRSSSSRGNDHDTELRFLLADVTVLEYMFGELRQKVQPLIGDISQLPTRISKKRPGHMLSQGDSMDDGLQEETQIATPESETQEASQEEQATVWVPRIAAALAQDLGDPLSSMFDVD